MSAWKHWLIQRKGILAAGILLWGFLNLYLGVICASRLYGEDFIYLNVLLSAAGFLAVGIDFYRWKKIYNFLFGTGQLTEKEKRNYLGNLLYEYLEQEKEESEKEIQRHIEEINDLSDYITKWSHEVKLPLAALKLMNERNMDGDLQKEMQQCIVRMETCIHTVMMGSKLERPENDVRCERISLSEAVRESIQNQSWYLIHEKFQMHINVEDIFVYTDKRWLVYLLDQLIGNAIKYRSEEPVLQINGIKKQDGRVELTVEDNGIGIPKEDLPHIFQKGYVGKNQRKGDYRSTGMGLYFVRKIAEMMQIHIKVESTGGCRFTLQFYDLSDYYLLEENSAAKEKEKTMWKNI